MKNGLHRTLVSYIITFTCVRKFDADVTDALMYLHLGAHKTHLKVKFVLLPSLSVSSKKGAIPGHFDMIIHK